MTIAFAPMWQRAPSRRVHVIALLSALVLLGVASGPRLIVDFRDLRCPPGDVVAFVGPAHWALACVPATVIPGPASTSAPISRSVVLSLNNLGLRVFAFDFLGRVYEGPASLR